LPVAPGRAYGERAWRRRPLARLEFELSRKTSYLGIAAALGVATGAILGALIGNFGLWLGLGLVLGAALGALLDATTRPHDEG